MFQYKLGVDDFADVWNVAATNKKYCVSVIGHACAHTLGETAEVFGEAVVPYVLVWTYYEVEVLP